ncbi:hypothetical protein LJR084_006652 [Variovorax sp. LjRoot84]
MAAAQAARHGREGHTCGLNPVEEPMAELETEFHYNGHDVAITLVE